MRRPDVRYAVVVADPARGRRIAAVLPWGAGLDVAAARVAVAAEHGRTVADTLVVVEPDDLPLTEQGKPDRAAIMALAPS